MLNIPVSPERFVQSICTEHIFAPSGLSEKTVVLCDEAHLAVKERQVLVLLNEKDFLPLTGTQEDMGIIGVSPHLIVELIDVKLTALLIRSTPNRLTGKFTPLTRETEEGS